MSQIANSVQGAAGKPARMGYPGLRTRPAYWLALFGIPAMCVAWVLIRTPFSKPMSNYWTDASVIARTGWLGQRFTPSGYPFTMALSLALMPAHPQIGFALEQGVFHLLLVLLLWLVMRRLHASPAAALWGTLLLQADPDLLLSVEKVWDVAFSTWLLLLIAWLALRALQDGATLADCCWLAAALGYCSFDRPNYIFLVPALVGAVWFARRRVRNSNLQWVRPVVAAGLILCVTYMGLSLLTYREVRTPENGAYNLFAGNNQFSRAALLEHLNAEPSIVPALAADGILLQNGNPAYASLIPFYRQASRRFAWHHPLQELTLVGIKFWTLLRPDTKVHPLWSVAGMGKLSLAMFVPVWLFAVVSTKRGGSPLLPGDWLVLAMAALYILPFLMTNADPRFRTPLDILVAAHTVALFWRNRYQGEPQQAAADAGRTMERTSFSG